MENNLSETFIHPTAQVHKNARIDQGVKIGAFCVIGEHVTILSGSIVHPHIVIAGHTEIGHHNEIHSFASIGGPPQDLSYKNEPTKVKIGDHNIFREYVSINRGTLKQDGITLVGSHCMVMSYCHLGHDVNIGDHVRIVNSCHFAGHVKVGDRAIISGACSISQFVTIGKGAFIGGGSGIDKDIPCYTTALGNRVHMKGINIVGLKRMGYDKQQVSEVVDFYRTMEISNFAPRVFCQDPQVVAEFGHNPVIKEMMEFIVHSSLGLPSFMS